MAPLVAFLFLFAYTGEGTSPVMAMLLALPLPLLLAVLLGTSSSSLPRLHQHQSTVLASRATSSLAFLALRTTPYNSSSPPPTLRTTPYTSASSALRTTPYISSSVSLPPTHPVILGTLALCLATLLGCLLHSTPLIFFLLHTTTKAHPKRIGRSSMLTSLLTVISFLATCISPTAASKTVLTPSNMPAASYYNANISAGLALWLKPSRTVLMTTGAITNISSGSHFSLGASASPTPSAYLGHTI
eukprot:1007749-Rhodomonas_salina.1